jgi:acetyltransferase-like isoleucine patch superfamily enzyme
VAALDLRALGVAAFGDDARVYERAAVAHPERLRVGHHVIIDDFVSIAAAGEVVLGSHVHLAAFATIAGDGPCWVDDFATVALGARIETGRGVRIGAHGFLGANSVVEAGVAVGEGAVLGALAIAATDLEPWTIYVGAPARSLARRPRASILAAARGLAS